MVLFHSYILLTQFLVLTRGSIPLLPTIINSADREVVTNHSTNNGEKHIHIINSPTSLEAINNKKMEKVGMIATWLKIVIIGVLFLLSVISIFTGATHQVVMALILGVIEVVLIDDLKHRRREQC